MKPKYVLILENVGALLANRVWFVCKHGKRLVISDRGCSSRFLGECRGSPRQIAPSSSLEADRSVSSEVVVVVQCSSDVPKQHLLVQLVISTCESDSIPGRGNNFSHHIPCSPQRIVCSCYQDCSRRGYGCVELSLRSATHLNGVVLKHSEETIMPLFSIGWSLNPF